MTDNNRIIIDEQVSIPDHYRIITRTDLNGTILEANSEFLEISGYDAEEIIGQPHNILRHPDVPKAVFKDLWQTIQSGKGWTQIVKNRTKDGRYYWVKANNAPIIEAGKTTGYISVRTPATPEESSTTESAYKAINSGKLVIKEGIITTASQRKRFDINPFNRIHLMPKIALSGLLLLVLGFIISASLAETNYLKSVKQNDTVRHVQLAKDVNKLVKQSQESALNTAIGLAVNPKIVDPLDQMQQPLAKQNLAEELQYIAQISGKTFKVHLHDASGFSFVRSWTDKHGDDLTDFRHTVNEVRKTHKTVEGVELGRSGIAIRSISPIFSHQTSNYIGSLEIVTNISQIVDHFAAENIEYLSLLTPDALTIAQKSANNPKYGNLTLSSKSIFSKNAQSLLSEVNLDQLLQDKYIKTPTHFFSIEPIIDVRKKVVGYHVFIEELTKLNQLNATSAEIAIQSVAKVTIAMVLLILFFLIMIRYNVIRPIHSMVSSMKKATENGDLSARINIRTKDEMGEMANAYNVQMQSTQISMGEASRMLKDISEGRLKTASVVPMVGDFSVMKNNLNATSHSIEESFGEIRNILTEIRAGNFAYQSDKSAKGEFKAAMQDAQAAMTLLKGVFYEVNELMSQVAKGFFSRRIGAEAKGELQTLKDNINNSLDQLEQIIQEATRVMIAQGTGDLKPRIDLETDGTLAVLKAGINNSISNMGSLLSQSTYSIRKLSDGAISISKDISDLSARTQEQAASIEETAASMEQITSTIQQTATNAQEANTAANDSLVAAQDANKVVQKTIESINEINDASTKISEITALIDSIAFQTNLLALNAAVEAARAGDHGRGFAVVAGEVRSLAGKSAEAAKEIRMLIDDTVDKVHEGAKLADESGRALELINDSISKISTYVSEISETTSEQAKGVEQVNIAISSIDQVTQQNSALVDETAERTVHMSTMAEDVNNVISTFKIDLEQISFQTAMKTGMFTFAHARRAHRQWKGLVTAYIEGLDVEFNVEAATDHTKCALGQWYYGPEGKPYQNIAEMQEVEKWHTELHATIKQILEAYKMDDLNTVNDKLKHLDTVSDQVIKYLTLTEAVVAKKPELYTQQQPSKQIPEPKQQDKKVESPSKPAPKPAPKPMPKTPPKFQAEGDDEWSEF